MLVPVGEPQAMADAMHRVLSTPELQQQLLTGVRQHRQQFSFETTEVLFDQMISNIP
jgi:glycosyltransferase involved in cell wall biosynthesis